VDDGASDGIHQNPRVRKDGKNHTLITDGH